MQCHRLPQMLANDWFCQLPCGSSAHHHHHPKTAHSSFEEQMTAGVHKDARKQWFVEAKSIFNVLLFLIKRKRTANFGRCCLNWCSCWCQCCQLPEDDNRLEHGGSLWSCALWTLLFTYFSDGIVLYDLYLRVLWRDRARVGEDNSTHALSFTQKWQSGSLWLLSLFLSLSVVSFSVHVVCVYTIWRGNNRTRMAHILKW